MKAIDFACLSLLENLDATRIEFRFFPKTRGRILGKQIRRNTSLTLLIFDFLAHLVEPRHTDVGIVVGRIITYMVYIMLKRGLA